MIYTILKIISKCLKVLKSNTSPNLISFGFCLGFMIGFPPFNSLYFSFFALVFAICNISITAGFLGFIFAKGLSVLFTDLAHYLGNLLLSSTTLAPFWNQLFKISIFYGFDFNYTIVLGKVCISILLAIPLFFVFKHSIRWVRSHAQTIVETNPILKRFGLTTAGKWVYRIWSNVQ